MACLSYEQVSVPDTTPLTSSALTIPGNATHAEIQSGDQDVNYTLDGTSSPGGTRGMTLHTGNSPVLVLIEDLRNIRFCASSGPTQLNIQYFAGRDI